MLPPESHALNTMEQVSATFPLQLAPAPAPVIKSSSTSLSAQSVAVTATTLPAQHSRNAIIITPIRGRAEVCGTFSCYFPAL